MPPYQRMAEAGQAMKRLGFPDYKVKAAIKELLELYDKKWDLIEDENYKVLIEYILMKTEEDEGGNSKKKPLLHHKPEISGTPSKRLCSGVKKEQISTSVDESIRRLATASSRAMEHEVELPSSFQIPIESEEFEPSLVRSRSRSCERDRTSSTVENPNQQLANTPLRAAECYKAEISKTCFMEDKDDSTQSSGESEQGKLEETQISHGNDGLKFDCVLPEDKGRKTVLPQVAPEGSKDETESECHSKRKVVHHANLGPPETLFDMNQDNSLDTPDDEPCRDDMLLDFVPLAVMLPASPGELCGDIFGASIDGYSIGNCSDIKEDGLKFLESRHADELDKEDGISDSSLFDIASSSKGEVKIALHCNSAHQSEVHATNVNAALRKVEEKCVKYKIVDPSFSVLNLLREICECYLEVAASSATDDHLHSMKVPSNLDISEKSIQPDIPLSNGPVNGGLVIPKSLVDILPQISKCVSLGGLDGLHCINSFKPLDIKDTCGEIKRLMKVIGGSQSLDSCSVEYLQNHCSSCEASKPHVYCDDITRGEEKEKIPLVAGSSAEQLPTFFYIPQNLIHDKAHVNSALACISDEDCCSKCYGNCLLSAIPCACAQKTGGEFAYTAEGLLKEMFLEECISPKLGSDMVHLFYCRDCPLEKYKNKIESKSCKGHLVRKFIKECWSKCGCSKTCGNRVVQRGISVKLQVFPTTEGKGWGLQTVEDLPKGAFVCEYVGEIFTDSELHGRNMEEAGNEKHTYSVLLDADLGTKSVQKDEETLWLDSKNYGNAARFINHRCSGANLIAIPVEVENPDHHYYHVAFFTTRKVAAMEELTWDYGIDFDDEDPPFMCFCGSSICRDGGLA